MFCIALFVVFMELQLNAADVENVKFSISGGSPLVIPDKKVLIDTKVTMNFNVTFEDKRSKGEEAKNPISSKTLTLSIGGDGTFETSSVSGIDTISPQTPTAAASLAGKFDGGKGTVSCVITFSHEGKKQITLSGVIVFKDGQQMSSTYTIEIEVIDKSIFSISANSGMKEIIGPDGTRSYIVGVTDVRNMGHAAWRVAIKDAEEGYRGINDKFHGFYVGHFISYGRKLWKDNFNNPANWNAPGKYRDNDSGATTYDFEDLTTDKIFAVADATIAKYAETAPIYNIGTNSCVHKCLEMMGAAGVEVPNCNASVTMKRSSNGDITHTLSVPRELEIHIEGLQKQ
jgi:hypothetical protein